MRHDRIVFPPVASRPIITMGFQKLLQPHETLIGLVYDGERLPAPGPDDIDVCTGQHARVGIQVDQAALTFQAVVPARLQVRHLHCIANALHVAGGLRGLWPEYCGDTGAKQMTDSLRGMETVLRRDSFNLRRQFGARQHGPVGIYFLDRVSECNFLVVVPGMEEPPCEIMIKQIGG